MAEPNERGISGKHPQDEPMLGEHSKDFIRGEIQPRETQVLASRNEQNANLGDGGAQGIRTGYGSEAANDESEKADEIIQQNGLKNPPAKTDNGAAKPAKRGFAAMSPEKQREIASRGGKAAHEKGTAHQFSSEEARAAGRKGGEAISQNRDHMANIGRRGGQSSTRAPGSTSQSSTTDEQDQSYDTPR